MREVLAAPCLAEARVLAGASGLDRIVSRLNVMEVPGHPALGEAARAAAHHRLPAARRPGRRWCGWSASWTTAGWPRSPSSCTATSTRCPPSLLAEADRRGFPIIEFPQDVGFDDVLNEVIGTLLNRQAALAARSEEVHRALVSVVLDGGDLDDLAAELATILGGPVLVTTPDGRVVAQAGDADEIGRAARARRRSTGPAGSGSRPRDGVASTPGDHCAVVPIVAGRVDHGRIVAVLRRTRSPTPTCTASSGPRPSPRSRSPRAWPWPRSRTSTGPTSCATC